MNGDRSPAKEVAGGEACRRLTFAELDDLVYNVLQIPLYHFDLIGIQKVTHSDDLQQQHDQYLCSVCRQMLPVQLISFYGVGAPLSACEP